jgi:hypothetical protein
MERILAWVMSGTLDPETTRRRAIATRERQGDLAAEDPSYSLFAEDALFRAQQAIGLIPRRGGFGLGRRIAIAVAITWLPLVLYALWQRLLFPGTVPEPFLQHFGVHARFLLALPLLLLAESSSDAALRRVLPQFVTRGIVDDALRPAFQKVLQRGGALRGSRTALLVMIAAVALATILGWAEGNDMHELAWESTASGSVHFGALWFSFVSRPVFLLVLIAWAWRLGVLAWTFSRIASLELRLAPTHPDRTAGLGFLEQLTIGMAPLFFAIAVPIAGRWGHEAMYHGLDVHTLKVPTIALVAILAAVGLAPLLAFAPRLKQVRKESLAAYGALLAEHGRFVERRWIRHESVDDHGLLSAPELGPVADTVALYEVIAKMRTIPVGRKALLPVVLASALPLIPVFAMQIPLKEIVKTLLAPLIGI